MNREELAMMVTEAVSENQSVTIKDLRSNLRRHHLVKARCMAFKVLRKNYGFSLSQIGTFFCRHHASVIHGLRVHDSYMDTDREYASDFAILTNEIMKNDVNFPLRQQALEFLEELEMSKSIGSKIALVENLITASGKN